MNEPKYSIEQRLWCMAQVKREDGWDNYITQAVIESWDEQTPTGYIYYDLRTEKGDVVSITEHMLFETKAEAVNKWKYIYRRDAIKAINLSHDAIESELGAIRYEREQLFERLKYLDEQV